MTPVPPETIIINNEDLMLLFWDVALYVILQKIMHESFKTFLVMYVFMVSSNIFGYLQEPRTTLLCLATIVTILSRLKHHHIMHYV